MVDSTNWKEYCFFRRGKGKLHRLSYQTRTSQSLVLPPELNKYIIVRTEQKNLGQQILILQTESSGLYSACYCHIQSATRNVKYFIPLLRAWKAAGRNFVFILVDK